MIIYNQETDDGLAEKISASSSVAYASILYPATKSQTKKFIHKSSGSFKDSDLYYVQSILVSSSWNKNDDIFDKSEVWNARKTPEDKPTNLEHDENLIIGHITSNWPINEDGEIIEDDIELGELPEKFHILTGSVIYRAFSNAELKERAEKLISEIENGSKYVSMECYFQNFDYGVLNQSNGKYQILPRNETTAYLTKYLRSYGGTGEHENHKIGRVLRSITFSGKGFVDKPANPDSIIFTKENINKLFAKKNDNLSNSGVILNQSNFQVENKTMSENIEKQVAELGTKLDTVSAGCADKIKEAYTLASELKDSNHTLEAAMKEKEEEMKKMKAAYDTAIEEMNAMKAAFQTELESVAKKYQDEKMEDEEKAKKTKSELDAANEVIVAMKMEKEEMAKKEKKMKRMASLLESGLDNDTATATVDKFDTMDDESFDAMIALFAAMKPSKKEEKGMMNPTIKKNMSSEEIVSALEEIEPEDNIDLGVGNDTIESQADSIRAELIEFVSARLNRNS